MVQETQKTEVLKKQQRLAAFLERNGLDALVLGRQNNFAWATGGASSWVNNASEMGVGSLIFRKDGSRLAVMNNIEAPRLQDEENLKELGFEMVPAPWWENGPPREKLLLDLAGGPGKKLGSDWVFESGLAQEMAGKIARERYFLTEEEFDRFRKVGRQAAIALESVAAGLVPGLSEWEIAGELAKAVFSRGLVPIVTLAATDERIYKYRHPIPTDKRLEKYAMVVLCARGGGLVASCTRLVHFGPLSGELKERQEANQQVDAVFNLNSRPGVPVREIFEKGKQAYAEAGFPGEWQNHHQGGGTGYESREFLGNSATSQVVQERQAFAWNPSISGIKVEDTVLVSPGEVEVITRGGVGGWPVKEIRIPGLGSLLRPEILVK